MTRAALLLPCLFAAACTVGEFPDNPGGGTDAGGDGGGSQSNGCVDRLAPPAIEAHKHAAGGGTNAGTDCNVTGCHGGGGGGPVFTFTGTVYEADGTTPSVSAVVLFKTADKSIPFYTDDAGTFHVPATDTTLPNPFSGNVAVTGCPTIHAMAGIVTAQTCNGTDCHSAGGTGGKLILPKM